jgi:hypothetical protein
MALQALHRSEGLIYRKRCFEPTFYDAGRWLRVLISESEISLCLRLTISLSRK